MTEDRTSETAHVATFPATLAGLSAAAEFFSVELERSGAPVRVRSALLVAIDEIGSNIVRYSGAKDFTVSVEMPNVPPFVRISFSDAGTPYNPLKKEDPDVSLSLEEREVGGLGLFMVKKMMDEFTYTYVDGRNVLTIGKLRS